MHSVNPKVYQLQHEIHTLQGHMRNAQCRAGMNNPAILHNYRDMIRMRKELIALLQDNPDNPMDDEIIEVKM